MSSISSILSRRVTLLRTFSLIGAAITVLVALFLIWSLQNLIEGIALNQETTIALGQAETLLHAGLLPQNGSGSLTARTLQHLTTYTAANMSYEGDVRVKIWGPDGSILYSDSASIIGRRFSIDTDLANVLSGTVTSAADISDLSDPENETERTHFSHLLEVYVPIRVLAGGTNRIVGAYEIYHDLTALDAEEAMLRRGIIIGVSLGFLVLYVSLFLVVRNASNRIERQREENVQLFDQREEVYLATLDAMARTIDARDPYTAGHSQRVARYAVAIGSALGFADTLLRTLHRGGVVHDIGKIGVSDAILKKPGRLTPEETAEMQRHPVIGYALLRDMPFLTEELSLIRHHHERWAGGGYPDGLSGDTISVGARILAVADAYDAMTSDRPYRRGMPLSVARTELVLGSGTQFWPDAVDALVSLLDSGALSPLVAADHASLSA